MLHKGSGSYAHFCPRPWLSTCRWARARDPPTQRDHTQCAARALMPILAVYPPYVLSSPRDWAVFHKLAHTAGRRYFSSARESQHHTNLPTCLAARKKRTGKLHTKKGGPERLRACQSGPERPRWRSQSGPAPGAAPSGPERSTEANPRERNNLLQTKRAAQSGPERPRAPHRVPKAPWESQKTAFPEQNGKTTYFRMGLGGGFFLFSNVVKDKPEARPDNPTKGQQSAHSGPKAAPERRRAAQSGAERASAPQSAQEPRVA